MIPRSRLLAVAVAMAIAGCARQAPAPVPTPAAVVRDAEVRRILTALAHDSMEGRRTGTPGADRAAAFIASEMNAIGVTAAGDSGFFQEVPFVVSPRRGVRLLGTMDSLSIIPPEDRRVSYNVIGYLGASDPALKDEVVVIGAHYDALGIRPAVNGDSIVNGADDDASGVTAVLEIARALARGPAPKRTIGFPLATGEGQGILGTRGYGKEPAFPITQTVADI